MGLFHCAVLSYFAMMGLCANSGAKLKTGVLKMQLIKTLGIASLYRKESYFGRSTASVEWIVKQGEQTIRICNTRREALQFLEIYSK
jgi:hypothetical protein